MKSKAARVEFRRILLPVEFSELSEPAELSALALATSLGAAVHALHVIEPLDVLHGEPEVERFYQKLEKRAAEALSALTHSFEAEDVPITWEVAVGHRWNVIVQRARELDSDLIVMGTCELEDAAALGILSSTSHRVALSAPCPVMLAGRHTIERARAREALLALTE
jgi:nucleotide-binding universal stress UspA family protein